MTALATEDKETLNLGSINRPRIVEENIYDNTDINLKTVNLTTQDGNTTYSYDEDIILNFTVELVNPDYYDENVLDYYNKTLYINNKENSTTTEKNYTLSQLTLGKYTSYYTIYNIQSSNLTFTVIGDSEITTDQKTYDHIDGIKNKITLNITDPSEEKGSITITVKDQDEYTELSTYSNVVNEYQLSTEVLLESLENLYTNLNNSYTINITYTSYNEYTNPNSTEFTLNIIKKRNTTIEYNILNNTEGNVEIDIMVLDAVYKTRIPDAQIEISGVINNRTTAGIITDNTLTPGDYNITVIFNETDDYHQSNTTIDFTVEIDKDVKIAVLENELQNLTDKLNETRPELDEANKEIDELNNTINNLTEDIKEANKRIDDLVEQINEIINKPKLNTTLTVKPIQSQVGSPVQLSVDVVDQNGSKVKDGRVLFKVNGITLKDENGNTIYAYVSNGTATISYKVQSVWMKNTTTLQTVYSGSDNYNPTRITTSGILNVSKGTSRITLDKTVYNAKSGKLSH